jgi:hypothetical protein
MAQNNPTSVNPTSGKGQAKMYIPGMKSLGSTGVDTVAQQAGASMYSDETGPSPVVPITAPTGDGLPVTDGAPIGAGANALIGLPQEPSGDPDIEMIRGYYPILEFYASQPGSSQGTKDYVKYLGTILK